MGTADYKFYDQEAEAHRITSGLRPEIEFIRRIHKENCTMNGTLSLAGVLIFRAPPAMYVQ